MGDQCTSSTTQGQRTSSPRSTDLVTKQEWEANAKSCYICGKEFTLARRRHHCRGCGKAACDKCCPRPSLTDQNRLCVRCK
eukprot:NODE_2160_length_825_cov_218.907216_g1512_i0.p4 GENE.NODE_2160_length_825_cov_218.907216_g1512_i0~~NODE_2160_length_825_cov_218.907216_g1512_i0.p4  ORF type:complete len:81 (-),score=10.60 NODE_2160_length_825_cov_218.907216_g1512_i0:551-793(-)